MRVFSGLQSLSDWIPQMIGRIVISDEWLGAPWDCGGSSSAADRSFLPYQHRNYEKKRVLA